MNYHIFATNSKSLIFSKNKNKVVIAFAFLQMLIIIFLGDSLAGYPIFKYLIGAGRFDDFYNTVGRAPYLPDIKDSYIVSPALIFLFRFASLNYVNLAFAFYNIVCISIAYFAFRRLKINPLIALALLVSYPMLFAISRGNAELLVFGIVLFGVSYLVAGKLNLAVVLMLAAATIKPTSLIFLALFPIGYLLKKWALLGLFFLGNLLVFYLINTDIFQFIESYFIMLDNYKGAYVLGTGGDLFNNSLYGLAKTGVYYFFKDIPGRWDLIGMVADWYGLMSKVILIACILCVQLSMRFSSIEKIWILAASVIFFPAVSADYRLLYLLIPLALILIKENCTKIDNILFYGTLIILIPKHFVLLDVQVGGAITLQSVVNPVIFSGLLYMLLANIKKAPQQ